MVVVKNVSQVSWFGVKGVRSRLSSVFKGIKSCGFGIMISGLNNINRVFLKDSWIVFFLNTCKQILVIWAKN